MTSTFNYNFNNMDRIGTDDTDISQKNIYNTRFTNYTLSNYFSNISPDSENVDFATQQPTMMFSGTVNGNGIDGEIVDRESDIFYNSHNDHPDEKLMLITRPFLTIPYLGRGSCDPVLESQLLQGEVFHDKKSVSTIMEKSFNEYSLYPIDNYMKDRVEDPAKNIEEAALNGWIRGGILTRDMTNDPNYQNNNRPNGSF
jgi:hypothetical protein